RALGRERNRAADPIERFRIARGGRVNDAEQEVSVGVVRRKLENFRAGFAHAVEVAAAEPFLGRAMPIIDGVLRRFDRAVPRVRFGSGILYRTFADAARRDSSGATRNG